MQATQRSQPGRRAAAWTIAVFGMWLPDAALAVSGNVRSACRSDYFQHCKQHAPDSPEVRGCMRAVGERLSMGCLKALAGEGQISKADIDKHTGTKPPAAAETPKIEKQATKKPVVAKAVVTIDPKSKKLAVGKNGKTKVAALPPGKGEKGQQAPKGKLAVTAKGNGKKTKVVLGKNGKPLKAPKIAVTKSGGKQIAGKKQLASNKNVPPGKVQVATTKQGKKLAAKPDPAKKPPKLATKTGLKPSQKASAY